jgi:hypothetical protein
MESVKNMCWWKVLCMSVWHKFWHDLKAKLCSWKRKVHHMCCVVHFLCWFSITVEDWEECVTSVLLIVCSFLWRHTNLVRVKRNYICGSFVSTLFAAYITWCIFKLDVSHFSKGDFLPEWMEGMNYFLYLSVIRLRLYHNIFHVSVSFQLQFVSCDS